MKSLGVYKILKDRVDRKIDQGKRHLVIWGFTPSCIQLISDLKEDGNLNLVEGIIDSDFHKQGQTIHHVSILAPHHIVNLPLDLLVIASDAEKELMLRQFALHDNRLPDVVLSGSEHYKFQNSFYDHTVSNLILQPIAGGYPNMLIHIFQCLEYVVKRQFKGAVAEFGVYQGGSLLFIAKTLRSLGWKGDIYGFDLFDSTTLRHSVFDIYPTKNYNIDINKVQQYLAPYDVKIIKGDICETHQILENTPLLFSFFDTDFYSPTKSALKMCYKNTVIGGIIAFDHYISEGWEETIGERIAANEFFENKKYFQLHGTGIFIKI